MLYTLGSVRLDKRAGIVEVVLISEWRNKGYEESSQAFTEEGFIVDSLNLS